MVNGLGVLGWGVGRNRGRGGDARRADLDARPAGRRLQAHGTARRPARPAPISCSRSRRSSARVGVVGKFVEFFGHGLAGLPLADRATIANMAPECGATCNFFPVDDETLRYLELTARPAERIALVEAYAREQGLFHDPDESRRTRRSSSSTSATSSRASPAPAGRRTACRSTQARRSAFQALSRASASAREHARRGRRRVLPGERPAGGHRARARAGERHRPGRRGAARCAGLGARELDGETLRARARRVVIAAITSCTNTSNPAVMVGAGLLAQARRRAGPDPQALGEVEPRPGLEGRHRVPRPGRAHPVPRRARLQPRRLRLHDVHRQLGPAAPADLGGDRGRRPGRLRRPFRATATSRRASTRRSRRTTSPPPARRRLRARRAGWTSTSSTEPLGQDREGNDVYLRDLWPSPQEIQRRSRSRCAVTCSRARTPTSSPATSAGTRSRRPSGTLYAWDPDSTYVRRPPYFDGMCLEPEGDRRHRRRALPRHGRRLRDDRPHLARRLDPSGQPRRALPDRQRGRARDFNSYGSRRGNHEVMVRGTFANVRLRNLLVPGERGLRHRASARAASRCRSSRRARALPGRGRAR